MAKKKLTWRDSYKKKLDQLKKTGRRDLYLTENELISIFKFGRAIIFIGTIVTILYSIYNSNIFNILVLAGGTVLLSAHTLFVLPVMIDTQRNNIVEYEQRNKSK